MERPELLAEARRAFERGRRRVALRAALLATPLAALSLAWNRAMPLGVALAVALVALSTWLAWRGGVGARAVRPGLVAGLPPMLGPLLTDMTCAACAPSLMRFCFASCIVGGLAGGALLWRAASRIEPVERARVEFVLAGGAIASIAGTLGCVLLGFTGVAAMIVALAVLSAPAALVRSPA